MKSAYCLTTIFFLLFSPLSLTAQNGSIMRTNIIHEEKQVDALSVTIQPKRKDVQKAFDDWIDDRYDINMKGGGIFGDRNLRSAEAIIIPDISTDNITLFTETETRGDVTLMKVFASRGLGNYLSDTDTKAFAGLKHLFDDFLGSYLPEYHNQQVVAIQQRLQDLREAFADTEEDIAKNENRIEKLQLENTEFRINLRELTREIEAAERELTERRNKQRQITKTVSRNN